MSIISYIWDYENDSYLAETDALGDAAVIYTVEPDSYGRVVSQRRGGVESYIEYDAVGSCRQLTDASGATLGENIYDAFGNVVLSSVETVCPFQWKGELGYYLDSETSTFYVRRRDYAPEIARWTSVDAINTEGAYTYSLNTPVMRSDPAGTFSVTNEKVVSQPCGLFSWPTHFEFSDAEKRKSLFYVVQKITMSFKVLDCGCGETVLSRTIKCGSGHAFANSEGGAEKLEFYEIWIVTVAKDKSVTVSVPTRNRGFRPDKSEPHDKFGNDKHSGGSNTKSVGEYSLSGSLFIVPPVDGEPPGKDKKSGKQAWDIWGIEDPLFSDFSTAPACCNLPPEMDKYVSTTVSRTITWKWDCCDGVTDESSPKVVVKP